MPADTLSTVREFAEYRPWKSWAQFDKEIGKYAGPRKPRGSGATS